ncbi:thiopeptide-type bacteriocin biosynthesis protein [Nonomuraea sp. NPDC005692]|uniref:thiopeptide-type bacteriocin biosynthesis protein n=1 Tax=Nonomuraea sp. NPDC005692 TaxID=3157168 RepID=UPI0033DC12E5
MDTWTSLHCFVHWSVERTDDFLTGVLGPLMAARRTSGWFFIRYWEGGPHLRVRALGVGDPAELERAVTDALADAPPADLPADPGWTPHGIVKSIAYEPETGRYGEAEGIGVAERVFCRSTETAVEALSGRFPQGRMSAAIHLVRATTLGLGLDERAAAAWLRRHAASWRYTSEVELLPPAVPLARTARLVAGQGEALRHLLAAAEDDDLCVRWSRTVAEADGELAARGLDEVRRLWIWASQLHMLCNRLGVLPDEERAVCWLVAALLAADAGADQRYLEESKYPPGILPSLPDDSHGEPSRDRPPMPGLPEVRLPEGPPLSLPLGEALNRRASCRTFTGPVGAAELGSLLGLAFGARADRTLRFGDGPAHAYRRRPFPGAGARYGTRLRLVVREVEGLDPGTYHVGEDGRTLRRLGAPPADDELAATSMWLTSAQVDERLGLIDVTRVPAVLLLTAHLDTHRPRYGTRALRFALLEAGHVAQNLTLAATALGLGTITLGGFYDDLVHELFGLDGVAESALYLLPVGLPG